MVHVTKATGQQEHFSEEKLRYSIHRAGIPDEIQHLVVNHIKEKLYEGIPTSEIYHHIIEFLDTSDKHFEKAKYSLKQSIMALGPTGYPFEDFIAEILKPMGYQTTVRTILQGSCISHEIDVIAEKENKRIMIEAKFHNSSGTRSDSHVPMYTKARFDDVRQKHNIDEAWVVTNTKATVDAINYADCVGMKIVSWSLPEGESLRDLIERSKLHPITSLTSLTQAQIQQLLENHIVLSKDIHDNPNLLNMLGLPEDKKNTVLKEVEFLCSSHSQTE